MYTYLTLAINTLLLARSVVAQTCKPCDDVHFFLARGNNEPYPGRQAALVSATCDGVSSCGYEDLIYSALYTDLSCQTTYDGAIAGISQMTAYAKRCPKSKLILAGYSQGAQIVTDILGGGGGVSFNGCVQPNTPALDRSTSPGNKLAAVLAFGNTRHTANQPYNFGSGSDKNGLFPRIQSQLSGIADYADITRDWCDSADPICAQGKDVSTHLGYYNVDSQAAASWIRSVAKIQQDDPGFKTVIPISVSGTAQDYATIPPGTPSGSVQTAAVTLKPASCSATTTSGVVSSSASTTVITSNTMVTSISTSGSISSTITSNLSMTWTSSTIVPITVTSISSSTTTYLPSQTSINPTGSPAEQSAISQAVSQASKAFSAFSVATAAAAASDATATTATTATTSSPEPTGTQIQTGAGSRFGPSVVLGLCVAAIML